ncbi:hypothetical protein, partial [Clavibacter michiganensis]|uniref:hypothetical protein n=1 Tax=Clavibacter michiganensis TaxID=28447 RepID=UPI00292CDE62
MAEPAEVPVAERPAALVLGLALPRRGVGVRLRRHDPAPVLLAEHVDLLAAPARDLGVLALLQLGQQVVV